MSSTVVAPRVPAAREPYALLRRLAPLAPYAIVAVLSLVLVFLFFHLWGTDLSVPITPPGGDYWFEAMVVKSIVESGWYFETPRIGAPGVGQLYDFPMAEALHVVIIKILGILCGGDFSLTLNVFYILGYVLTAVAALLLFRGLSLPVVPAMGASLLYTFLPQHYIPAEYHLFLTAYYMVPLIVLVMMWLLNGEPLASGGGVRSITRKGWLAGAIAVGLGAAGVYYAFFGVVLLAAIAVHQALMLRKLRAAAPALVIAALVTASLVANISPSILYHARHGKNTSVAARSPAEADMYALKIAQLVLPIHNHRVPAVAAFKQKYLAVNAAAVPANDLTVSLGAAGAAGFLLLIAAVLFPAIPAWAPALRPLGMLNLAALLVGTLGGFGSLFAYTVSPDIRCYYRIVVYIAAFSLAALLVALKHATAKMATPARSGIHSLAGIVLTAALLDLTPQFPNSVAANAAVFRTGREFIQSIERSIPKGASVFQLPYHGFPESGFNQRLGDYDHLRGYLFSDHLRWSYGAIKGREHDLWQKAVSSRPVTEMGMLLREWGFAGVYVDSFGYADNGAKIHSELATLGGPQRLTSEDGRFSFFALPDKIAPPAGTSAGPAVSATVAGCSGPEGTSQSNWFWCGPSGEITLINMKGSPVRATLAMELKLGKEGPRGETTLSGLGVDRKVLLNANPTVFRLPVEAPPGISRMKIACHADPLIAPGDPRTLTFAVLNLRVEEAPASIR